MFKFICQNKLKERIVLAKEVCLKLFKNSLSSIHAKRTKALFDISWTLTKQANLSLTSLGRHKDGSAYVKHKIKSVDRLLGSKPLQAEVPLIYKDLFKPLLMSLPILFVVVDWSGCCRQDQHMLRAALIHDGKNFRDDKNYRWGSGWRLKRTYDVKRIPILCLIAAIAAFFMWWIGLIAEDMGIHRRFQVNTEKNKRTISLLYLGKQVLYHLPQILEVIDWHKTSQRFVSSYKERILCL